uniref:Cytochrome P450 26A1-like n=1 Tax=Phallusia mammillata TaxID=59560 RepID=A0A6F9D9R9_9ASCI|nr:cytochrome P450 26A1-like [Phallusia mammillata]
MNEVSQHPGINASENATDLVMHLVANLTLHPEILRFLVVYLVTPCVLYHSACYLWTMKWLATKDSLSSLPLPDGIMGLPIIGETLHFLFVGERYERRRRKQFGNVYKTHLFGRPTVVLIGEENIRPILLGEGNLVEAVWPETTRRILGTNGIVNGDKNTHTKIKRLALRAFSPKFINKYSPVMISRIESHIKEWQSRDSISVFEACTQMVSKTMMTVLLGISPDDPDIQRYIQAEEDIVNSILCLPIALPGFSFYKGLKAQEFIFKKVETKLRPRLESSVEDDLSDEKSGAESVMVNILKLARAEQKTIITLENLQNLSLEFIFAGSQSLRCSSSLLMLHLSQRPQIIERLRQEIREVGLWDTPLVNLQHENFNKLPYLCRVVNETMRVTPTIPGAIRVALKTFQVGKYQIPKGWQVIYSIRFTHEEAAGKILHKEDKTRFEPEKDLHDPENEITDNNIDGAKSKASSFSFVPFGKGARMCAGKNYGLLFLRLFLFQLVRSVDINLVTKANIATSPMMRAHKSVKIAVKPYNE